VENNNIRIRRPSLRDKLVSQIIKNEDYLRVGARIAALGLPSLFVMEGGYAVAEIGINAVNALTGFAEAR